MRRIPFAFLGFINCGGWRYKRTTGQWGDWVVAVFQGMRLDFWLNNKDGCAFHYLAVLFAGYEAVCVLKDSDRGA